MVKADKFGFEGEMPVELQLDLLVDAELPEEQRRSLLLALERDPSQWRGLALRFLERQVEKQTVGELMEGGTLLPRRDTLDEPVVRRLFSYRWMAVAAGVLICVTTVAVTVYVARMEHGVRSDLVKPEDVVAVTDFINAAVPGKTVGLNHSLNISVPIVEGMPGVNSGLFAMDADGGEQPSPKRSLIIQSDGSGNAVMIPVNTLPMKVY